jgi:hypothetical protein
MDIKFERTNDAAYIYASLTDPKVWRMSADDNTPEKEFYFVPTDNENILWIKAGDFGLFMLCKQDTTTYEVHVALNKYSLGTAEQIAKDGVRWAFGSLPDCRTLVARIPSFNHVAMGLAARVGFKFYGVDQGLFVKDGVGHDMHVYILKKEDICHQQQERQQQQ